MEWKSVVFAQREEFDGSFYDLADAAIGTTVALGRKRSQELRVAFVSGRGIEHRTEETLGGDICPRGVEVHPECGEDLSCVAFELLPLQRTHRAWLDLLPLGCLFGIGGEGGHLGLLEQADGEQLETIVTKV